ncbi:hypothetical protein EJ08DRAFT_650217 [Tothia fuscella]|uniref:Protection of telomeres protein 1 n=1 Tax=Tothia fuscella TaxID=1048955 RepID=A0A9P4TYD4_9PEZI|nr:hypothetical protein EJ08DRAFT_650217 [Tothia fuscella]
MNLPPELRLPPNFTPVSQITPSLEIGTYVNLIGVVVDYMPPCKAKGGTGDWMVTIGLRDPSNNTSFDPDGLKFRLFKPNKDDLPHIQGNGDIIILWDMKYTRTNFAHSIINSHASMWLVFPKGSIPDVAFGKSSQGNCHMTMLGRPHQLRDVTPEQKLYVMHLNQWAQENGVGVKQDEPVQQPNAVHIPTGPKSPAKPPWLANPNLPATDSDPEIDRKYAFLKDVKASDYKNLVAEVVKTFPAQGEVYITDYTENNLFYEYIRPSDQNANGQSNGQDGDVFGYAPSAPKKDWVGPWGKHTLCVKLWYANGDWARENVKIGDVYFFKNVHVSFKQSARLEGQVHEDKRNPGQVDVRFIKKSDPRVVALEKRKKEYWAEEEKFNGPKAAKKRSKAEKKKLKALKEKNKRQKLDHDGGNDAMVEDDIGMQGGMVGGIPAGVDLGNSSLKPKSKSNVNPNVICPFSNKPLLTLSEILDTPYLSYSPAAGQEDALPFLNQKARIRVRVVDFHPPNVEDFTQCIDDASYNDTSNISLHDDEMNVDDSSMMPTTWEWAFYLMVEDWKAMPGEKPRRMRLIVSGHDAECLIGSKATDLHNNPQDLLAVKEKLFILWGNLEELKKEGKLTKDLSGLTNKYFECMIQEYGVPQGEHEWVRVHRICQTPIR